MPALSNLTAVHGQGHQPKKNRSDAGCIGPGLGFTRSDAGLRWG